MISQLAHICIFSSDLEATARFYFEALGLMKGFEFMKDGTLFGYYIKLGNGTYIEVFKGAPAAAGNINHVAIQTDDIDAVMARLSEHGYDVGEKKLGVDHTWQVWTTDPNGVRIEFQQYTPQSLQFTGGTCLVDW